MQQVSKQRVVFGREVCHRLGPCLCWQFCLEDAPTLSLFYPVSMPCSSRQGALRHFHIQRAMYQKNQSEAAGVDATDDIS